jgi:phosphoribosyl-ATP pyrophosphohydrolase
VCHDGYPTCFYRRLEPDNSLTVVRDRWFDPEDVYGEQAGIAANTKRWWGAYEFLRDNDLSGRSSTSRLLRDNDDRVTSRIADELRELAGALDGTHRHATVRSDVALEGGQSCYWIVLRCVREGITWESVRPDRALDIAASDRDMSCDTVALLLRHEASRWSSSSVSDLAAGAHAAFALIAQACACAGVQPGSLIVADLNELRTRDYLDQYFAQPAG